jgi:hypothetical protein
VRCAGAQKEDALEGLGEEVGALGCGRDLLKSEDAGLDLLLDVVVFHVNVLGALGGSVRMGHVDGPLIVDLESGWPWETREGPIMEKAGEPCDVARGVRGGHVFGLRAGLRHGRLS